VRWLKRLLRRDDDELPADLQALAEQLGESSADAWLRTPGGIQHLSDLRRSGQLSAEGEEQIRLLQDEGLFPPDEADEHYQETEVNEKPSLRESTSNRGGRTLVVDPTASDAYQTISAAVADAGDGDTVSVHHGRYTESVVIHRAMSVIGDGKRETIVVEGREAPCFILDHATVRLANLTIEGGGPYANELSAAVLIKGGAPTLERLELRESHGIVVRDQAMPTIRGNIIRDGQGSGVSIGEGAGGTIEDNEIYGNAGGIMIADPGTSPTVRGNLISGGSFGVVVLTSAGGTIEDNQIYGNAHAGIMIADPGTSPTVRGNIIRDGQGSGVSIGEGAGGTIEDNEIYGNTSSGISISDPDTDPMVRGNIIRDGESSGVDITLLARGTIEDNEIYGNTGSGISIFNAGKSMVRRNIIRDGLAFGLHVAHSASRIEDNQIFGNAAGGISIYKPGNKTRLQRNLVRDNG